MLEEWSRQSVECENQSMDKKSASISMCEAWDTMVQIRNGDVGEFVHMKALTLQRSDTVWCICLWPGDPWLRRCTIERRRRASLPSRVSHIRFDNKPIRISHHKSNLQFVHRVNTMALRRGVSVVRNAHLRRFSMVSGVNMWKDVGLRPVPDSILHPFYAFTGEVEESPRYSCTYHFSIEWYISVSFWAEVVMWWIVTSDCLWTWTGR